MMFDLIEAAEDYPRFLPWCAGATILVRDDSLVAADLDIEYRGMRWRVGTRNPKRRPEHMAIHLVRGPFRHFEGHWRLAALGDDACRVEFELTYEFDSALATQLAGPVFGRIADTLVDAFVKRAHSLPVPATTVLPTTGVVAQPPVVPAPPSAPSAPSTPSQAAAGDEGTTPPPGANAEPAAVAASDAPGASPQPCPETPSAPASPASPSVPPSGTAG
jgi:ribosome-associated toxin RatA of RatAB toxin-antitoxin module